MNVCTKISLALVAIHVVDSARKVRLHRDSNEDDRMEQQGVAFGEGADAGDVIAKASAEPLAANGNVFHAQLDAPVVEALKKFGIGVDVDCAAIRKVSANVTNTIAQLVGDAVSECLSDGQDAAASGASLAETSTDPPTGCPNYDAALKDFRTADLGINFGACRMDLLIANQISGPNFVCCLYHTACPMYAAFLGPWGGVHVCNRASGAVHSKIG